ncbi:NEW3 domain-containing protein [Zavarzinella formosa]|uniref:NEW3 domain-containing protein n=1 Tax=Zavarzinella formosa TaxID=360055 RepID=UPI00030E1201|nr:NEW3 domain-containing protein [Zavarzinella formosa]
MTDSLRLSALAALLAWVVTNSLSAQQPGFQTREPPFAGKDDTPEPAKLPAIVRGGYDPDEAGGVRQAEFTVPGATTNPAPLPGAMSGVPVRVMPPSVVKPAGGTEILLPAGELPTPTVTLNIEGADVSPSGQAVIYKLVVRNNSRAKAHHVVVRVIPPAKADKVKAEPPATADDAETRWELKTLEPGQTRTIEVVYKPRPDTEEMKIQARVQFDFGRGMVTHVSPPAVSIKKEGAESLVLGDVSTYKIIVKNTGRVTIRDLEVKERLDKGLVYEDRELARGTTDGRLMSAIDPKSGERMWAIPALAPGQSQTLEYRVKAKDTGKIKSQVMVKAADILKETSFDTEVLTANLQIQAEGPATGKGMVGQAAGYRITVSNRGTAELKNVCLRCLFPPDMKPTRATNSGQSFRDSVQWIFEKLAPGDVKEVNVSLSTGTPGARTVQFAAKADKGPEQKAAVPTEFAGVPALGWDTDVPGTASVGKTITYKVTVSNTGTAAAQKVQLRLDLPSNVDFITSSPDAAKSVEANSRQLIFQPYDIPAGKKTTFTIEVKARSPGEARVIFRLHGEGAGADGAEHRNSTTITDIDNRSPTGPAPKFDSTRTTSLPK